MKKIYLLMGIVFLVVFITVTFSTVAQKDTEIVEIEQNVDRKSTRLNSSHH